MGKYQLMPPLTETEYKSLKDDIAERGIIVPIELDENGDILDGHHRLQAYEELNNNGRSLPPYPRVVRAGMSEAEKRNYVRVLNLARRHLSREQLETQWAEMRKDGATYQEIADATGTSEATVRRSVSSNDETQPESITGKDGKKYPPKKKRKKKEKPPKAPQFSEFVGTDKAEEKARQKGQKVAETGSEGAEQQVQVTIFSSESHEYYTPSEYIEAARQVMNGIDLDPASCEAAQQTVKAKRFFSELDDGLEQEWVGSVWLNPPYGKTGNESNQAIWAQKLIGEYKVGRVAEAILLVKAAVGYNWFEELWYDWPTCFARERLSFIKADGSSDGQSKQGTAFFYFGPNIDEFKRVFGKFGRIIMPENEEAWQDIVATSRVIVP